MANVEHSSLTGSDLHEPKGVAAAPANRVYVSNGSGSGSWSTVGLALLDAEANAFQDGLLHIQDQKSSGTAAQSITSGDWRTRELNTVVTNQISGASLASNQISLPAGSYHFDAMASSSGLRDHKLKLFNVSDSTDISIGMSSFSGTFASDGATDRNPTFVRGRFTLAAPKNIELRHRSQNNGGGGEPNAFGVVEVYSDIMIWKIG